jgi:alpha-mannosidase
MVRPNLAFQRIMLTFSYEAITGGPNSDKDGVPGNQEDRRVQHVIPQAAVDAGTYEVIIEVSCNGMFGLGMNGYRHQRPDVSTVYAYLEEQADESFQPNRYFNLAFADIVLINSEAVELELDFEMVRQVAQSGDREHSSLSHRALRAANDMMNAFRASNHYKTEEQLSAAIEKCRRIAARVLGDMSEERRKTLCTASRESGPDAKMWAIGHW